MTARPRPVPRLERVEARWRMAAPSGRVLECVIYQHVAGVEVRCQFSEAQLLRSQTAPDIGTARDIAEQWRQAVLEKSGFTELLDREGA